MHKDAEKVLISKDEIQNRVKELAKTLEKDYAGKRPLMLCILKGSVMFFTDLIREMDIPLEIDFMAISSYGNSSKSSGEVKLVMDLDRSIQDRHVLIVEDIVDSGYTLTYLKKILQNRGPTSVKICTLLDKIERREVNLEVDYKGFDIGNEFVIGYGLDYAQEYRNLPEICVLKRCIYEKN